MRNFLLHWFSILFIFFCQESLAFENRDTFDKDSTHTKVLVFLSRNCPCSKSHIEHLNNLQHQFQAVHFYGVMTDLINEDTKPLIDDYYSSKNFSFPIIRDDEHYLVQKFSALKTPHTVIVTTDKGNNYKIIYQGGVSNHREFAQSTKHFLAENLSQITNGKPVKYAEGKSLGCYIRRL